MKKYRIILKDGDKYMPQVKGWFFWHDILNLGYDSLEKAEKRIHEHYKRNLPDKVIKNYEIK